MSKHFERGFQHRRTALATALALGLGVTGLAYGQATTGSVFGTAPVASGETVRIVNNQTGLTREVPVDNTGRFNANQLPVGDYTVSLVQSGNVIASHDHVQVSVAGGAAVPFAAAEAGKNVQNLSSVTVTANSLPAIDVSSTRQTSVITAQQLKQLPLAHNAESIAMLAPGVAAGNTGLGNGPAGTPLISFSGDSVVENAYYINGFNTTDPVGNAGGIALPYFAIAEQQTITSGYGAEYGRSTGGVISQVGQRGGNTWHAGVYATFAPSWAQTGYDNIDYANSASTAAGQQAGDIYNNRRQNSSWSTVYDAYLSGPLIKDTLFFYITGEIEHDNTHSTGSVNDPYYFTHGTSLPKFYGKLDWNINDSNTLEYTNIQSKVLDQFHNLYNYDYNTNSVGSFAAIDNPVYSSKFNVNILKYTSYITDDLTLSVLAGKMKSTYFGQMDVYPGLDPALPGISQIYYQNPNVPGNGNTNPNPGTIPTTGHKSSTNNFRLDLDWKLGDHDLRFGIDNQRSTDIDDGTLSQWSYGGSPVSSPGYYWAYNVMPTTTQATTLCNNVGQCVGSAVTPANPKGYYVQKTVFGGQASFTVEQKAQYIEDNWQVNPNLLLNLGLRNDQFINYNGDNIPYIRMTKPQWAPRLGFSWDILGDSSAKLYGNVGRYYLALPSGLGARMAGSNSYLSQYYTYTSIDANGVPQGLTQIPVSGPGITNPYQQISPDGEEGVPKDPKVIAATNLKPMYQDEYVLGFQKAFNTFGQSLVWTSQATWSKMKDIIDDTGSITLPANAAASEAGTESDVLVNPGRSNTLRYLTTSGTYATYTWNPSTATSAAGLVQGFPAAFRNYYSLEESLEHPWDGKWMAKIDYVFARSYGTTEGPTDSPVGQISNASGAAGGHTSGSITEAWDFPELMQYSNGDLPNMHKHTLKVYGTYAITPEWLLSGSYIIQSGSPISCLGYYGPNQTDPDGYGESYHWCGGQPSRPGDAGNTPWTHQLNLGVSYIPAWAGKHLTLQVQVQNVFNEQKATAYVSSYGSTNSPDPTWLLPVSTELPRYAMFSAKYDW
ncbi:TonB-dependent receptor [Rhodanobacter sp. 7MK24]|uniref:TonB-dependent receptor n=1 Tax=Rhodanobacter sp. 7MK24 TaxID=2775922 RepID=UPI00177E5BFB|nr:TonB-dependent receptor [Rhodanobacter sp. 7MK24]MBD8882392.1 TonB-dependent receptor [Rhodanobacter sp. 7MK24]